MSIDYPLLPVGDFDGILAASRSALLWLAEHGPGGAACPHHTPPLLLAGDSSGGGTALSLLVSLQRSQEPAPRIAGAVVLSPWTNLRCDTRSYYDNKFSSPKHGAYSGDIVFRDPPKVTMANYRALALDYVAGREGMLMDPVAS